MFQVSNTIQNSEFQRTILLLVSVQKILFLRVKINNQLIDIIIRSKPKHYLILELM